jgi:alpha-tubulin suppressor-like RCC1 family protein
MAEGMRAAILVVLLAGCDWVLSLHHFEHDAPITTGWVHVAAGQYFTCAIDAHRALYCWGYNGDRELGGPSVSELDAPALVAGATWTAVTAGNEHACGLQTDNTLWCWGSNWTGQIGDGTMTNALQPVRIGTGTWKMVDTRGNTTCAIDSSDQLYC